MPKLMKEDDQADVRPQMISQGQIPAGARVGLGRTLCGVVMGLACLDLMGWALHIPLLTSVVPHYSTMKPNTAAGLGLVALACWMRQRLDGPGRAWRRMTAVGAAVLGAALSFGTLAEYAARRSFGLDDLILRVPADRFGDPAGRPSLGTAGCLALLSLAMLWMEWSPGLSVGCLLTAGGVAMSALVGFVFNAGPLFGVPWLRSVAVHTATGILLLCIAGLAARPEREPIHSLMQQTYREGRTRWLLVGVTLLPMLVALLPMLALRWGIVDTGFALAIVVVTLTAVQTLILWRDSVALGRAEMRKSQVERALIQSEKLAVVGRLSASIAHEVRNPLEAVNTLMYLIRDSETLEEARSFAMTAESELARMNQITSQTLSFYRENRNRKHCDPAGIVESALTLLSGKIAASEVTVERHYQEDAGEVNCQDGELRQVFINLISNALEATPAGGRLVVRTRASRDWARRGTGGVRVVVADSGCGMPDAVRVKVFEPFFTTKMETGNGLGLWVAKDLIEKLGGTIRVWSSTRVGASGTVFSVFLPFVGE
ncbi:sensor histidine kinase [Granulicella tundricola]|uniref:histidine kinase n=1 Tax=Granulicella tundricola (strain ATCC BAA-1859 / DSM 23138 / MP5ACTX9) TaxID=1198114 RepID=E8WZR3_GRATM|nr:ATP-binding protein [Granulicella tundricola]ADW67724.1 integral membrane sensor signal transduction histidine kinase [Granulicella tundricola MP5ACTX9]